MKGLKAAWKKATGLTISSVVFCFVTTHTHSFDVNYGSTCNCVDDVPEDYCSNTIACKFLTVGGASFLPFDGTRPASRPIYHELMRGFYMTKDEATLKD